VPELEPLKPLRLPVVLKFHCLYAFADSVEL
jgi:hypothetical protein